MIHLGKKTVTVKVKAKCVCGFSTKSEEKMDAHLEKYKDHEIAKRKEKMLIRID